MTFYPKYSKFRPKSKQHFGDYATKKSKSTISVPKDRAFR